ncbi:MAG TPA: NADH-quinone oxidoreductase subunit M [Mycobacteriales bacterium]|nr:NADH-quinone oxidoreductase subunit M [Mycobacteriales bacterium]
MSAVVLALLPGAPLLAAVLLVLGRVGRRAAALTATTVAAGVLLLAVGLVAVSRPWATSGDVATLDVAWIGALGVRLHLGLDGIGAPLVLLTSALTLLVCAYLWAGDDGDPGPGAHPGLLACVLLVEAGAVATFTARDLVVFFVAFEVVLVPMWFVVARFGDDASRPTRAVVALRPDAPRGPAARADAASRFVLYTALGSAVMLLGIVLLAVRTGTTDLVVLARLGPELDTATQVAVAALLLAGLAVKVPVWPLHTWLPAAHTIAPTVGSVLLAGVLLKLGSYGMVRLVLGLVPAGLERLAPALAVLGLVGIVWGSLACVAEHDLKRLVAFSSVAHMGFVVVGIASMTPQGVQGALFANVAHGVVTGLLFLVVGMLKHRHHTADLAELGSGLRDRAPRLGWLLALGCAAGLGLPGLAGFWGELLAVLGAWEGGAALGALARPVAVAAAVGTVLAAVYLLRVLYLVWHGPRSGGPALPDARTVELATAVPLAVATVALGLLPWLLLSVTAPAVRLLLGSGS